MGHQNGIHFKDEEERGHGGHGKGKRGQKSVGLVISFRKLSDP